MRHGDEEGDRRCCPRVVSTLPYHYLVLRDPRGARRSVFSHVLVHAVSHLSHRTFEKILVTSFCSW